MTRVSHGRKLWKKGRQRGFLNGVLEVQVDCSGMLMCLASSTDAFVEVEADVALNH
jgi:phosphoribosyl-AMP cyclohydrolase